MGLPRKTFHPHPPKKTHSRLSYRPSPFLVCAFCAFLHLFVRFFACVRIRAHARVLETEVAFGSVHTRTETPRAPCAHLQSCEHIRTHAHARWAARVSVCICVRSGARSRSFVRV